jgi:hypothetical protein
MHLKQALLWTGHASAGCGASLNINQSINVTSVAMKFVENSCQAFTENHLFG